MASNSRAHSSGVMSSFHNFWTAGIISSLFLIRIFLRAVFTMPQAFSMGDRSGDFAGHQGGEMLSCSNHSFISLEVWIRALSCWKITSTRLFSFSSWGSKCSVSKSRYFRESMVLIFPQDSSFSTRPSDEQTNQSINQSITGLKRTIHSINQSIDRLNNQPLACTNKIYFFKEFYLSRPQDKRVPWSW